MTSEPLSARDERLANLLSELSEQASDGSMIDFHQVRREHPDLADEVQHLLGAVMVADAVGTQVKHEPSATLDTDSRELPANALQLPSMFGDYELLEELGRGGMGIVYRAHQKSLNREVAVKMLLRGQLASEADEARFRVEAESAARLQHPGIVPVYEVGKCDGRLFFSMQYVPGITLAKKLADGPLDPRESAKIVGQVARAIDFAHGLGVLHRDLKPSNILIDKSGDAHVMDFGLAQRVSDGESLTRTGAVLGTPTYMSPEQAAGRRGQLGPPSDVYSLGSVLYHTLAGRPPFQAASPVDVVLLVLEQEPLPPRVFNAKVDRDLGMIALRCLQKPPDLRYETAAALADDLDAYLADEPVSARSGHFSQIIGRWFRETHHAVVLQNWGLLWMWHSLVLFVVCALTNLLQVMGDDNRIHYFLLWTAGLGTWAAVFWWLRQRMGPVTFVERQIAHVWAASMISIGGLFPLEYLLDLPALTLTPLLGLSSGMVFLIKAGMLTGTFYVQAAALFLCSLAIARFPDVGHLIFGTVSALCFFIPGWKYHKQKLAEA
ncbi:MAG: serine/threonine-protein kinase [Planctomycetota bacterium]